MVFKVYYQDVKNEVPQRERTKSLYIEANSKREVLNLLADRDYNIEFVQLLSDVHLDYERQSENFKLENV